MISIFLAKVFAIYLLVSGCSLIKNHKKINGWILDFWDQDFLVYFTGVYTLIIGTLLIVSHNIWRLDPSIIITLLSWITFFKGVSLMFFPDSVKKFSNSFYKTQTGIYCASFFIFLFGFILFFYGFCN